MELYLHICIRLHGVRLNYAEGRIHCFYLYHAEAMSLEGNCDHLKEVLLYFNLTSGQAYLASPRDLVKRETPGFIILLLHRRQ